MLQECRTRSADLRQQAANHHRRDLGGTGHTVKGGHAEYDGHEGAGTPAM